MSGVLLDTHAMLWLDSGAPLEPEALAAIASAQQRGGVLVSAVSTWEIGMLLGKGRVALDVAPDLWLTRFLALPGVRPAPLSLSAGLGAASLPGAFHGDPADRLLVATARDLRVPLVTRDRKILDYAAQGHVSAVRC